MPQARGFAEVRHFPAACRRQVGDKAERNSAPALVTQEHSAAAGAAGLLELLNQGIDPDQKRFRIVTQFDLTLKPGVARFVR